MKESTGRVRGFLNNMSCTFCCSKFNFLIKNGNDVSIKFIHGLASIYQFYNERSEKIIERKNDLLQFLGEFILHE
jgi:hypothetical protein